MESSPETENATATPTSRPCRRWCQFSIRSLLLLTLAVAAVMAYWVDPVLRQRRVLQKLAWEPPGNGLLYAPMCLMRVMGHDYFPKQEKCYLSDATDDDLVFVGQIHGLKDLHISHNQVTDAGLAHLRSLTQLSELMVYESKVTGSGLRHLSQMRALKELYLGGAPVTDLGVAHLQGLKSLEVLAIDETRVTDAGLVHLRGMTNLKKLLVDMNPITDAGLMELHPLVNLRHINLHKTKVTVTGVARLKAALPDCEIAWDEPSNFGPVKPQ